MSGQKPDQSKLEFANHPPKWVGDLDSPLLSPEIKSALEFYVAYCPCKGVSARGVNFSQYGWSSDNPKKNDYLYKRLFEVAGLEVGRNLFVGKKREDEKALFASASMGSNFYAECNGNRIAVISSGNLILDLCRSLRNGIAHCRFDFFKHGNDIYLALENGETRGNQFEVKARYFISVSVLSSWVEVIKNESGIEKRLIEEERIREQVEIEELAGRALKLIEAGRMHRVADLETNLGFSKKDCGRVVGYLKSQGLAEYSNNKKCWKTIPGNACEQRVEAIGENE